MPGVPGVPGVPGAGMPLTGSQPGPKTFQPFHLNVACTMFSLSENGVPQKNVVKVFKASFSLFQMAS